MHVISRKALRKFWEAHPEALSPLDHRFRTVSRAGWRKFSDVRATYASADAVGKFVVFNVGGNKYRIVVEIIDDDGQMILVRGVSTHAEYDGLDLKD